MDYKWSTEKYGQIMGKKIVRKELMKKRREKSVWRKNEQLDDKGSTKEKCKIHEGAVLSKFIIALYFCVVINSKLLVVSVSTCLCVCIR